MSTDTFARLVGPHLVNLVIFGLALTTYLRQRQLGFLLLTSGYGMQAIIPLAAAIGFLTRFDLFTDLFNPFPSFWIISTYGALTALLFGLLILSCQAAPKGTN